MLKELDSLCASKEEDEQCTGAEILAGVCLATRHAVPGATQQLGARLSKALQGAMPDSVDHWMDCLRLSSSCIDLGSLNVRNPAVDRILAPPIHVCSLMQQSVPINPLLPPLSL